MNRQEPFKFSLNVLIFPMLFGILIWAVYWFELSFGYDFNKWGVYPRTISGLKGVLFSPFIHSSVDHLYSNTLPLMILSAALFYFYEKISWQVLLYGILFSGILTWCIGRPSYHIGASGLIYVLVSFLFFKGLFAGNRRLIALSLIVVFAYGSMFWYMFPVEDKISWEGHLSGFITGLLMAVYFKAEILPKERYIWEQEDFNESDDPFLRQFDENGNFVPYSELELRDDKDGGSTPETTEKPSTNPQLNSKDVNVIYHYRPRSANKGDS